MLKALKSNQIVVVMFLIVAIVILQKAISFKQNNVQIITEPVDSTWQAPSLFTDQQTAGRERELVIYGEELVTHTGNYFGPHGLLQPRK